MSVTVAQSTATITIASSTATVSVAATTPSLTVTSSSVVQQRYWGAFADYTTQTIASTTTAYAMTLNTTDISNGVSVVSGSRVTFAVAGTYNFQWSGQFECSSNQDQDVTVWLRKNGTDVTGSTGLISVPSKHGSVNGHTVAAWNYVMEMSAGDYLQLYWAASSTAVTLPTYAAGTTPTTPTTASLIVTAQQV
jgi:hypothetical protein